MSLSDYVITRQGRPHVLYVGLLNEFHVRFEKYSRSISTELLQLPTEDNGNVAVVRAVVRAWDHDAGTSDNNEEYSYSGIGDASPENVGRAIAPHIIRMAETRAKARALRDAINVSQALADDESTVQDDAPQERPKNTPSQRPRGVPKQQEEAKEPVAASNGEVKIEDVEAAWKKIGDDTRPEWDAVKKFALSKPPKTMAQTLDRMNQKAAENPKVG